MLTNYKGYTIEIVHDEYAENPRKMFDHLGTIFALHKRYNFNETKFNSFDDFNTHVINNKSLYLPIYLYDHSGLTVKTSPFSCIYDSGLLGYIFVNRDKILKEYSCKCLSKGVKEKVFSLLNSEVEELDDYLTGNVYGYQINKDNAHLDSCYGFYGDANYCLDSAKETIDYIIAQNIKNHLQKLKIFIKNKVPLEKRVSLCTL